MKRNAALLILFFLLAGAVVYRYIQFKDKETIVQNETAPRLHTEAPAFDLQGLDGRSYHVGGKRDKPLLLNFWASWCSPCEEEAPELSRLYEKYKNRLDLYAVNVTQNDDLNEVKRFASRFQFGFPVLLDMKLDASDKYRFQVIPTSFLINKDGVIVDVINLLEPNELEKKIRKLIDNG